MKQTGLTSLSLVSDLWEGVISSGSNSDSFKEFWELKPICVSLK